MDIRRCYDILDVPLEASAEDIKRHHRDLVNIWHPDRFLGNPRLQEKAEQKLSEINAAYDAVIGFLEIHSPSHLANGQTPLGKRATANRRHGGDPTGNPAGNEQPYTPPKQWATAKPKWGLHRLIILLMLISIVVSAIVMLPKIKKINRFLDNPVGFIEKTVDQALNKISGKTPKTGTPWGASVETTDTTEIRPQPKIKICVEIYLKNGGVIMANSYRLEGDMIIYRIDGGSMGIQYSKVKTIKIRGKTVE